MITINKISSSSKGNAVLVSDGISKILLDAGISYQKLSRSVKMSEVEAVLITHSHMDHYQAAPELIRRGADVYMSRGTAEEKKAPPCLLAKSLCQIETDNWYILPFDVEHDSAEPLGFLCQSKNTGEKLVYIVDSAYVAYDFSGVTHWLIECNYCEDILENGEYNEWLKSRVRKSHFSIANLKTFLSTSDLSKTKEIHLLHLSDSNSDEKRFVDEIEKLTGVPTYA